MRMWGLPADVLCKDHFLGEHREMHLIEGAVKNKHNLDGYLLRSLINPRMVAIRHDELVRELIRRGYQHHTPIDHELFRELEYKPLDIEYVMQDLFGRCWQCRHNFEDLYCRLDGRMVVTIPSISKELAKRFADRISIVSTLETGITRRLP